MAADFDAGSIEGTLRLNTKPFYAGLKRAQERARQFERERHEAHLSLDTSRFDATRARAEASLAAMGRKSKVITPDIDVKGVGRTLAGMTLLQRALNGVNRGVGVFGMLSGKTAATAAGLLFNKFTLLAGGALTLLAAMGPLTGAVLAFGGAAASTLGPLAISFGLFGGAVVSAVGALRKANEEGKRLPGWGGKAQSALERLKNTWKELNEENQPRMFRLFAISMDGVNRVLRKMDPLLKTVTIGMTGVAKEIFRFTDSKRFKEFLPVLDRFTRGFTRGFGVMTRNLLFATINSFERFQPVLKIFGDAIERGSLGLRRFTAQGGGLQRFVDGILPWLPKVGDLIGSLFTTLGKISTGLAPLAGPALEFVTALVDGLGNIDWNGLANILVPIVQTLTKLLPKVVDSLNWVINLLEGISDTDAFGPAALSAAALYFTLRKIAALGAGGALASIMGGLFGGKSGGKHAAASKGIGGLLKNVRLLAGAGGLLLLAKNAKKPVTALTTLGDVAGGAALGFAIGGPWGAAIGAVGGLAHAGLKAGGVYEWFGRKLGIIKRPLNEQEKAFERAERKLNELDSTTASYGRTLDRTTGAVTKQTREMAYQRLQASGLFEIGKKLGLTERQLTLAVTGNRRARELLARRLAGNTTLTLRQRQALLSETGAVAKNKVEVAKNRVEQAKMAVATAKNSKELRIAQTDLRNARKRLRELREEAKNDIKVRLQTAQAKRQARELKGYIQGLFSGLSVAGPSIPRPPQNLEGLLGGGLGEVLRPRYAHAKGGVTSGEMWSVIGDNPGGREAVIPLNEYDVPRKGDIERIAAGSAATNQKMVEALSQIASALRGVGDPAALAEALDQVMGKHSDAQVRKMVQMQRAG